MAIYTPRGLKVRLPVNYAFALMSRLHPRSSAFQVLKTTEALEDIKGAATFVAGIVCFALRLDPLSIVLAVGATSVVASVVNATGFYLIPGLVRLGLLYSYISGFGVLLVLLVGVGFTFTGWQGVMAFFAGRLAAGVINLFLEYSFTRKTSAELGFPLTVSERSFLNAYRLHASRFGESLDLAVSDEELSEENWGPTFRALAERWPEVVTRFTAD